MRRSILLVDDDDALREALSAFLEAAGFTVLTAPDGQRGLERLRQCRPGLILLDLAMPIVDGRAFRRAQLADPTAAHIPVICLTGQDLTVGALQELGLIGIVKKPFDFELLLDTIRFQTRYESLFDESFEGIIVTTPAGRIVDVNAAAAAMLGYEIEELRSTGAAALYGSDEWSRFVSRVIREERVVNHVFRWRRKDGRSIDCAGTSTVCPRNFHGGITIASVVREVTNEKRFEAANRQAAKMDAVSGTARSWPARAGDYGSPGQRQRRDRGEGPFDPGDGPRGPVAI